MKSILIHQRQMECKLLDKPYPSNAKDQWIIVNLGLRIIKLIILPI